MIAQQLLVLLVVSLLARAAPSSVGLTGVTTGGNGCNTTPQASISSDGSRLTISFPSAVTASAGPGTVSTDSRSECQVGFKVTGATGYKFAVSRGTFSGSLSLPSSAAKATIKGTAYLQGSAAEAYTQVDLAGSRSGSFSQGASASSTVWSSCGGGTLFNIKTAVVATSQDGKVASKATLSGDQVYTLQWSTC